MTATTYTAADGYQRTTCGQHRTLGYYMAPTNTLCRGCHLPASMHETSEETVARRDAEPVHTVRHDVPATFVTAVTSALEAVGARVLDREPTPGAVGYTRLTIAR